MQKFYFIIIIFLVLQNPLTSQACFDDNLTITSQNTLNEFIAAYPDCRAIGGNLWINGGTSDPIVDLSPLANIDSILGQFRIGDTPGLTTLNGLENLKYVGEDVILDDNEDLADISALNQLNYVGESFRLEELPSLVQLGSFASLKAVQESFTLNNVGGFSLNAFNALESVENLNITETSFTTISEFPSLSNVDRNITIRGNASLTEISTFNNIPEIEGSFKIENNPNLNVLNAFEQLNFVGVNFELKELLGLQSIGTSFASLDSVGNSFNIVETGLLNLQGFGALIKVGLFGIASNPDLLSLSGLDSFKESPTGFRIYNNDSLVSIAGLEEFDVFSLITGDVFYGLLIQNNDALTECNNLFICALFTVPFDPGTEVTISDNGPGCSDPTDLYYNQCRMHVCYEGGVTITSQEQIDSFSTDFPRCEYIDGDLRIGDPAGLENSTVLNLDGLLQLDTIFGNTIISNNPIIEDLNGLREVKFAGGDILIQNNDVLTEVNMFRRLKGLIGDIKVENNPELSNYEEPVGFLVLDGSLNFNNNPKLNTVEEFEELEYISGDLIFENNEGFNRTIEFDILEFLGGDITVLNNANVVTPYRMDEFRVIAGDVNIQNNPRFNGLSRIEADTIIGNVTIINNEGLRYYDHYSLDAIFGDLHLENNSMLQAIYTDFSYIGGDVIIRNNDMLGPGLFDLKKLEGSLIIEDNAELSSLSGIDALVPEGVENIVITNNESLADCHVEVVCNLLENSNSNVTIAGNTGTCADKQAEEVKCGLDHCFGGDIDIATQEEMDRFLVTAGGCSVIEGSLEIRNPAGDLDISGLINIREIEEDLELNGVLESLEGFGSLEKIGNNFQIFELAGTMEGFGNLETIEGDLRFHSSRLESFKGLEKLNSVDKINLFSETRIKTFEGLESLKKIRSTLEIVFTDSLTTLNGLQNVDHIGSTIRINRNDELVDIFALKDIPADSLQFVSFQNNPKLSNCSVKLFCDYLKLNPDTEILVNTGNAEGCQTNSDVGCEDYGVSGIVFLDDNGDGIKNVDEVGIPNLTIVSVLASKEILTGYRGNFTQLLDQGEAYNISLDYGPEWTLTTPETEFTGVFDSIAPPTHLFGLQANFPNHNASSSVVSNNIRCNEEGKYFLKVQNTGTFTEEGEIRFNYDPLMSFVSSSLTPNQHDSTEGTLVWTYSNFKPYESIDIELLMGMPNETFTGEMLENEIVVLHNNDNVDEVLTNYMYNTVVRCSYDPNDKQINPLGIDEAAYLLKEETVTYTLRFQNTGNDYARNIRLVDTIPDAFDMRSLEVLNASHPVNTEIEGNVVSFYFDDIYLIDSLTNPEASQGFVSFNLDLFDDTPDFTIIENTAHIFFDFNPPIITNTVVNTVVEDLPTSTADAKEKLLFEIYPNPSRGIFNVITEKKGQVKIYNATKQKVKSISTNQHEGSLTVDLTGFNAGIYYIGFISEQGKQSWKILFKE